MKMCMTNFDESKNAKNLNQLKPQIKWKRKLCKMICTRARLQNEYKNALWIEKKEEEKIIIKEATKCDCIKSD